MKLVPILFCSLALAAAQPVKTRNLVLVTADGLRWQELFTGIDPALMNEKSAGMEEEGAKALRDSLWRDTPQARREALLPFFWSRIAPRGVVLGNVSKGSSVKVTNAFRVSYPGYAEILTGRAQDDAILGNTPIQNPTPTVLEFLRERLKLERTDVALFSTWNTFRVIGEHTPGAVLINAGPDILNLALLPPRLRELNAMQFDAMVPWSSERHDYFTFEMALAYLRHYKPRVLHIAFGETDDWAHEHRYDRLLASIGYFDRSLRKLWETLQSLPDYRDRTTMIVTSDHGRGGTLADYGSHGAKIAGAEQIWVAALGPDTPARGEAENSVEVFQRDIAPTMIRLMGLDPNAYAGAAGKPISAVMR